MKEYKLPEILYKLLEDKHVSQSELSNDLCVQQQTIWKWLRKRVYPSLDNLMQLSDYFNVSIDYLVYGEEGA